eukprot:CAMPEP_0206016690 /NCGR_PEP_ID=MMETSP1464-20131121/23355_1 /ASSEMBLY_ACC=CAM_ASM_001124 /TAXON_ID=119497 /ORGANISM="Exanthemachrysis gayraliae, Strain RCC1523" /LENGTH=161 /DNA_ID=CAMNT_0053390515 /DNA_START=24 /DNA_END=506 /DNA_ORIENTATION=-
MAQQRTPFIGAKIILISKSDIRYSGTLDKIDTEQATVSLRNVQSFGTEDRVTDKVVPPSHEIYPYIIFRGSDIKDLQVCETPAVSIPPQPEPLQPAMAPQPVAQPPPHAAQRAAAPPMPVAGGGAAKNVLGSYGEFTAQPTGVAPAPPPSTHQFGACGQMG